MTFLPARGKFTERVGCPHSSSRCWSNNCCRRPPLPAMPVVIAAGVTRSPVQSRALVFLTAADTLYL